MADATAHHALRHRRAALQRAARRASCASTSCCCSATLGLIAFSLVTLDAATATDVPGVPDYFVMRQAIYAVVGLDSDARRWRSFDYSRFRELRVGALRARRSG